MDDKTDTSQHDQVWGDTVMPAAAAERQEQIRRIERHEAEHAGGEHPPQEAEGPTPNPLLAVDGHSVAPDDGPLPPYTTPLPQTDATLGNWSPLLGPGNEAMADGSSPAPRGYTGGAMGRVVSGLSPSFPEAATGAPPTLAAPDVAGERPQ
jgi:hypothetical protein